MIALLTNGTFWLILGTVAITALVIYFCIKSQVFAHIAKIAGIFLGVVLLGGSAIYSVYQVNGYYSAEGGIIGKITNTFKPNTVTANDFEIKVENIELQQEFEDIYVAEITINQEIKLENNKKYALFVNGAPTSCFASESNYIGGIYGYAFYGANNTLLLHDDLVIELALHKNYSLMFIYTMGGNTAVNYWNYYFNRNDFVVTIEEIDVSAINDSEEVTGVVPEYYTVSYCVDDEVVAKQIYHPNDTIALTVEEPEAPEDYHTFAGWIVNNSTIDETFRVTGNVVVNATFAMQYGLYDNSARLIYSWDRLIEDGYLRSSYSQNTTTLVAGNCESSLNLGGHLIIAEGFDVILTSCFAKLPNVTGFTTPSSCKEISIGNNDYSNKFTEIILNEGLETIGYAAFRYQTNLKSLEIPKSVITIDDDAFQDCDFDTIFIPISVNTIAKPFWANGESETIIYCESSEAKAGWDEQWNYTYARTSSSVVINQLVVKYGYTYEQYLAEINN